MGVNIKSGIIIGVVLLTIALAFKNETKARAFFSPLPQQAIQNNGDTTNNDTTDQDLRYPITGQEDHTSGGKRHPFDFDKPEGIERSIELDSTLENYQIKESIGGEQIGETENMSIDEYLEEDTKKWQQEYFQERSQEQNFVQDGNSIIPDDIDLGPNIIDQILSGGVIDIQPRGSAELIFKGDFNRVENPAWDIRQQRTGQFKFDQNIKLNVTGTIADRIDLGINYDTESQFQFYNKVKLNYQGDED